jgi:magnesium chelatase family protein
LKEIFIITNNSKGAMIAKVFSANVIGVNGYEVTVETAMGGGLPGLTIVGLPDTAVKESRDRIKYAIKNSGFSFPTQRLLINLAPADTKKEGTSFDLPIALSILACEGIIDNERMADTIFCGELSLDGKLKPIRGTLPIAMSVRGIGKKRLVMPVHNIKEASVIRDIELCPAADLKQVVSFLNGTVDLMAEHADVKDLLCRNSRYRFDFSDVKGQEHAKRGLEVAAAGGHNVIFIGPPGSGKSMLAKRLPTILSALTVEESLETSKIHSVAGLLSAGRGLVGTRPFRAPHHTISDAALVGGGTNPAPGEISLAHNGVLFLDELPEFKKNVLEVLRQPLEDGEVTISRVAGTLTYPSKFMLVAAMNPCKCGHFTDPKRECHCTPLQIQHYLSKISGPLLDRIDIHLEVPRLNIERLTEKRRGEPSEAIRERVDKARGIQRIRYKTGLRYNAHLEPKDMEKHCMMDRESGELLKLAILELGLSARAYDKILKVSRTIADLDAKDIIESHHVSEAISYRSLDRNLWG